MQTRSATGLFVGVLLFITLFGPAFAQPAGSARPSFEIADVQASAKTRHPAASASFRAGRYEVKMATMVDLIAAAYGVEREKVVSGPNWLEMDRFDVVAQAPATTASKDLAPMLQSLLADRFDLAVHVDSKPATALVLSLGSGKPKLNKSDGSGPEGCRDQPQPGAIPTICRGVTIEAFAAQLRGMAGDYLTSPVVDNTKLQGAWDFTLKWTPRGALTGAGADGVTIFDAIDQQLGLKLETKQVPMAMIVVDRVNRKPKDNPQGTKTVLLPRLQPHFEVATIKPTDPKFPEPRIQTPPNGLVNLQGVTLGFLIQTIWFVTPDTIAGAPKWLDTERWDISAKVAAEPGALPQTDMDSMIVMVRELLEDRFKLKTHLEERIARGYTLTAPKPRLQRADPSNRTGCKEGPGADGKDPRITNPALSRLVTCRNITLTQFAELLPNIANALNPLNGSIRSPVLDSTGLTGAYDFTLSFTNGTGAQPASPADGEPPAPSGALPLSEALSNQLGLKLEFEKRPAEVLVIDRVEPKPTEN